MFKLQLATMQEKAGYDGTEDLQSLIVNSDDRPKQSYDGSGQI